MIVITDRQVLDLSCRRRSRRLTDTARSARSTSPPSSCARAEGEQARIIISTLQKFPFVLAQLTDAGSALKSRTYAVIVDEAHSSQTGESAVDLKAVLGNRPAEDPQTTVRTTGSPRYFVVSPPAAYNPTCRSSPSRRRRSRARTRCSARWVPTA